MTERVYNTKVVEALFEGWEESIIWSCVQGVMGEVYADSRVTPMSAMAVLGDFVFFAGVPNQELVLYKPDWCIQDFIISANLLPGVKTGSLNMQTMIPIAGSGGESLF